MNLTKIQKIIIAIGALIILILLVIVFMLNRNNNLESTSSISVQTSDGNELEVNDFTSGNQLNFEDVAVLTQGDNFAVQFDKNNQTFQIALTVFSETELNPLRLQAEQSLIKDLGVNTEEFCRLNVVVNVIDNGIVNLPVYTYPPLTCEN